MGKKNNIIKGNNFEKYVSSLYETLGYNVKQNQIINGRQIDLVATKVIDGFGPLSFMIECKYLSSGSISNNIVYEFDSYIKSTKSNFNYSGGILITNKSFSQKAHSIKSNDISLLTIHDLEGDVFNLKYSFVNQIKVYEKEDIFNQYIPLSANYGNQKINNIEKWLFDKIFWVKKGNASNIVTLLGDYGSGKTTILKRLLYKLSKEYCSSELNIKPFYIELKNYYNFQEINSFLLNAFAKQFGKEIEINLLLKGINFGEFVLLLDGFDEMTPQSSYQSRFENFRALFPIINSYSEIIITCRPSYFITKEELNGYLKHYQEVQNDFAKNFKQTSKPQFKNILDKSKFLYYELYSKIIDSVSTEDNFRSHNDITIVNINNLTSKQIDSYLKKFQDSFLDKCNSNWVEIKEFLLTIYDLSDLLNKPILLKIITQTVLQLGSDYRKLHKELGASQLYTIYTDLSFNIEWNKGVTRRLLTSEQRKAFAIAISIAMFDNNSLEVEYDQILTIIKNNPISLGDIKREIVEEDFEEVAADIQICTFLTRNENNKFKFIHKSFMEFFLAVHIKNQLTKGIIDPKLKEILLPQEILYFIGSFCLAEKSLKSKLLSLIKEKQFYQLTRNSFLAFIMSNSQHVSLKLSALELTNTNIDKKIFSECNFHKIKFIDSAITNSEFQQSIFDSCYLISTLIKDAKFLDTDLNIYSENSTLSDCQFTCVEKNKNKIKVKSNKLEIKSTSFNKCSLIYEGTNLFRNCEFNNLSITFYPEETKILSCYFKSSVIICKKSGTPIYLSKTSFVNCTFKYFLFVLEKDDDLKLDNCNGILLVIKHKQVDSDGTDYTKGKTDITINKKKYRFDSSASLLIDNNLILINVGYYNDKIMNEAEIREIAKKQINEKYM